MEKVFDACPVVHHFVRCTDVRLGSDGKTKKQAKFLLKHWLDMRDDPLNAL